MTGECPIVPESVDSNAARVNATITCIAMVYTLVAAVAWVPLALAADYLIKSIGQARLSPLSLLSRGVVAVLGLKPLPVNAGPKIFAARMAFVMAAGAGAATLAGWESVALVVGGLLAAASGMEAIANFCLGCGIYSVLPERSKPNPPPPGGR